ncbi:hypothetical protein A3Q56_02265 [Intoshia linei]|uniref:Uncharacterized protein n=1 Tax=Intoshia linei TaxID=1819745 RepID=A0A177B992_9BILA|nr:hypothetical protein A3Q56_02265 [Intoshia linei]
MSTVEKWIKAATNVMIISNSECEICIKTKRLFQIYINNKTISKRNFKVHDVDTLSDQEIPEGIHGVLVYLKEKNGNYDLPHIYINQNYVGGYEDVLKLQEDDDLQRLL